MVNVKGNTLTPLLSVVVSVFNEEATLIELHQELSRVVVTLEGEAEFLFVNDGSSDGSAALLQELSVRDKRISVINLSRNFGHEAAMIAGIDHSKGDAVICMDADLQHPPAKIVEIIERFRKGYDVVCMKRIDGETVSPIRKYMSGAFYYFLNRLAPSGFEPNVSDFFMVSRRVADLLKVEFRERIRFVRGYIQTIGFRKTVIEYTAGSRSCGKSKYSVGNLCGLSLDALFSFSNLPLRLGIVTGLAVGAFSVLVCLYSIVMKFVGYPPSGYTTIVVLVSFLFAVQFVIIGIIGEYIGAILIQSRQRPIYVVESVVGGQPGNAT